MRFFAIALCLIAGSAHADTFRLYLGGSEVGQMTIDSTTLRVNVTDSPMGVANGTFSASSKDVQMADGRVVRQYLSDTPRKGRTISVLHANGQVIETTVSPSGDATDMSVASAVPSGVMDTIAALNRITRGNSCPGTMNIYEGRRVIRLSLSGSANDGATQTCDIAYRVTAGPGHLSPLYIRNAQMQLTYTSGQLAQIVIGSGPFSLTVQR